MSGVEPEPEISIYTRLKLTLLQQKQKLQSKLLHHLIQLETGKTKNSQVRKIAKETI